VDWTLGDLEARGEQGQVGDRSERPFAHTCAYICKRWVSRWIRRLLVVTGARCPLTKPVVTAVELQATTEPHCSRGVQPGGTCAYVVHREPAPGDRDRACAGAASASHASCRSGSIFGSLRIKNALALTAKALLAASPDVVNHSAALLVLRRGVGSRRFGR
jgi:hypothetical protein